MLRWRLRPLRLLEIRFVSSVSHLDHASGAGLAGSKQFRVALNGMFNSMIADYGAMSNND